jgi:vitamin B12 transporter
MPPHLCPSSLGRRLLPRVLLLGALACCLSVTTAIAQAVQPVQPTTTLLRGIVTVPAGRSPGDVLVGLLETSDRTTTDSTGRFALRTTFRGTVTVVARRIGFLPGTIDVVLPVDTAVTLPLEPQPASLVTMTVVAAGEYTLGTGRTATLTPLQIVQTPGAAGNIAKALQTLPGPQAVDEGTGLFVRGGDVTETRVLIDDAWLLSPARFDNPTGHVTSTVNPFLLDRTVFSTGGFGAQYGNALSGLVRLETAARPTKTNGTATASIGSVGAAVAVAPHARFGARISGNLNSLTPLLAIFGEAQPYAPPPRGSDLSATGEWQSSASGRVRLFALRQEQTAGVGDAGVVNGSSYRGTTTQDMLVLSWRDSAHAIRPALTVARSSYDRREDFNEVALGTNLAVIHAVGSLAWQPSDAVRVTIGGDFERTDARYSGSGQFVPGEPRRTLFTNGVRADRVGAHGDVSWQHPRGVRIIAGLRTDDATLTRQRTIDPRLSLAWQLGTVGLTAAWGVIHQVAEPVFYRPVALDDPFAPMRVSQSILGLQWGGDTTGLRLELYDKQYRNLWQFGRRFESVGSGAGTARGADLLMRWRFSASTTSRITWSYVDSRRTDPTTGVLAPALGDVSHSVNWITDRLFGRLTVSSALRVASGRPFTDIRGAQDGQPIFGNPNAERLPTYTRSDLGFSWYRPLGTRAVVLWGEFSNVFNRTNVMRYRWSADFRERFPVRAPFNRVLYAGATLLF